MQDQNEKRTSFLQVVIKQKEHCRGKPKSDKAAANKTWNNSHDFAHSDIKLCHQSSKAIRQ